jgi:hypothetical protein
MSKPDTSTIWDKIRMTLRNSAMSKMTIPEANEFQIRTTPLIGGYVRELVDTEIIHELKSFTGRGQVSESEILARIKELEATL